MTKQEFLRNNRGINDGQNLPDTILEAIFDEIQVNEIKMKDEHDVVADPTKSNTDYDNMSNRQKKEVFSQVSEDIAARSEAVFKGITAKNVGRKGVDALPFHVARHAEHARLMFEVCWMSILAGISAPLQEVEVGDAQTTMLVMTAFRCAVHLGSIFDLDIMRNAFASTLTKYAFLHSPQELVLKPKYVECVRAMLEIALADGNWLKETWLDVFRCVSHLERFLSSNVNGSGSNLIPGAANVGSDSRGTTVSPAKARPSMPSETDPSFNRALTSSEDKVADAVAQGLLVAVDRIFNSSSRLSGVIRVSRRCYKH